MKRLLTCVDFDSTAGLYYYRSRFYDPFIGRFISEDRIGFRAGDVNLYRYVYNVPVVFTDPSGRQALKEYSELHHIFTRLSIKSGLTEKFEAMFFLAGMTLRDPANIIRLVGHRGRHTLAYHRYVMNYLEEALEGLVGGSTAYREALRAALYELQRQLFANPRLPYQ